KTALELIRDHRSLEDLLEKAETEQGARWKKLREGQEGLGDFEQVRHLFLRPNVADVGELKPGRLDEAQVRRLLVEEHRFSADRVESGLAKYRASQVYRRQRTLGDF